MPLELLIQAGLTPTQAEILGFLLSTDAQKAKDIVSALKKPRGVIYKGLDELFTLGLVEKLEKTGSIAYFRAEHPSKLEALFEAKEKAAQKERQKFRQNLPELTSHYNLAHHKPGVSFFEGETGFKQTLDDTLRSKTDLLLFLDKDSLITNQFFSKINSEYNERRVRAGIKQRIIIADDRPQATIETKEYDQLTEIRYIGKGVYPFKSSIRVYDNRISYEAHENSQTITVLIEDKNIYDMNRAWFEYLWQLAT